MEIRIIFLLPNLVTARPLKGIVTNCPIGNANKIFARPASLKCNVVLISGMRLAQLAKQRPWQKKNTETAMRICSLEYAGDKVVAVVKTNVY